MPKMQDKSRKWQYTPRSEKDVDEHVNQFGGGQFDSIFKQGVDTWLPKEGDNTIRFLPPTWDDHRHYGYEIYVHGYVGVDNGSYLCLNKMKRKPCPVCEAMLEAKRRGEEEDAKDLAPAKRFVCWVLDRSGSPDPQLFSMSWTMDRDIAALCKNKRTGKILFLDHPYEGYDVFFSRKGKTKTDTKYFGYQIDHEPSPLVDDDKKLEDLHEYIRENPVPDQLKFCSYEYLKKIMTGTADDKDEELDEEVTVDEDVVESPRRAPRKDVEEEEDKHPKRTQSRRDEDEEDEEEDDKKPMRSRARDEDDDDEKPTKKQTRSKVYDEDDEEDEPEDEVAEDRPSKVRRQR